MKAIIILADATRYTDREVDEAALDRGYVEFSREPSEIIQILETEPEPPVQRPKKYAVCLHDGSENGVPVFRERRSPTRPTQKN